MKSNGNYTGLADVAPLEEELTALRRHLHQHPELSNVEQQTAALVADKLRQWGYQVTTGIGGYGVVGTLQVGDGGKRLALRADMD
ncbi:amidohydrolase, partial [Serratia rubidaea]|nr:amidohydrolase [Serratia rubidaea]